MAYLGSIPYFEYLKGKRVILVGPAGYLKNSNKGREIDQYDLITRVNLSCPVPEVLKKDVGSRTNILYHVIMRKEYSVKSPDLFKLHTRKEILSWQADGVDWLVTKQSYLNKASQGLKTIIGDLNWTTLTVQDRAAIKNHFNHTVPNTGTMAMWHILQADVKSLHVTGIDFYATGYYPGYNNFTEEQAAKAIIKAGQPMKRGWGQLGESFRDGMHNAKKQLIGINLLLKQDPRFTVDEVLRELVDSCK
jgi:hypothetical protein